MIRTFNSVILSFIFLTSFASSSASLSEKPTWQKPTPIFSQRYDWLRLKSDEWLKGDIISMYDDELEFESDEFGILTFDWEDVSVLRSRFDQRIRLSNGQVVQGFLIVENGQLTLLSQGKQVQYSLSELLSITSSAERRIDLWDGKVTLGIDVSAGNVERLDYFSTVMVQRRTPFTRFRSDLIFNYSKSTQEEESEVLSNSKRLTAYLDWFYSGEIFFRAIDYENFSDIQQNIDNRNTFGVSLGYHVINNKRILWDFTAGPSYQETKYRQADKSTKSKVVSLSTLFEYTVSKETDFVFDYQIQFVEDDAGARNHHLKTGYEFEFTQSFDLDLMLYIDRVAKPVSTLDNTPKKNDYRLLISLGYDF